MKPSVGWAGLVGCWMGMAAWGQAPASEIEALKAELRAAQEILKVQQDRVEGLARRVADLEVRSSAPRSVPSAGKDAPADPLARLTWKDGATTLGFPRAELRLTNRLQFRWTRTGNSDPSLADDGAFRVRRFKTQVQGWAHTPDFTFLLQVDWANSNTSLGILDDAAVDYDFTHGRGAFRLKAGQFKTPFGRQSLASTRTDMFADRSFATYEFCSIRDVGLMVHGKVGPKAVPDLLEYAAGLFNGEGRSRYENPGGKVQKNLRLVLSPWGSTGYDEAGPTPSPAARISLGAAYEENDGRIKDSRGAYVSGRRYETAGYDLMVRFQRFTAYAEWFDRRARAAASGTVKSDGLNTQIGFLVVPERWDVFAGRWVVDPDRERSGDRKVEWGFGTNVYFAGFASKLQADWRRIRDERSDARNTEFRVQYQILF